LNSSDGCSLENGRATEGEEEREGSDKGEREGGGWPAFGDKKGEGASGLRQAGRDGQCHSLPSSPLLKNQQCGERGTKAVREARAGEGVAREGGGAWESKAGVSDMGVKGRKKRWCGDQEDKGQEADATHKYLQSNLSSRCSESGDSSDSKLWGLDVFVNDSTVLDDFSRRLQVRKW
jgi:hypothetical protein